MEQKEYNFIDLFAGTGAFTIAFENNEKFKCIFANDILEISERIYTLNIPNSNFKLGDLNKIKVKDIPKHDILCGGFPCQPFSIAGKRKGFDDKRSNVFYKILEILKYHQPEFVVLENVKNLKSHDKGKTYKIIEEELTKLNYFIKSSILNTCKITGIPQHRERIYIVCFKNKEKFDKFNFDFPIIKNKKISTFLQKDIPSKYYYTEKLKIYEKIKKDITKNISKNVLYQYRRYYVRENKSNTCPTLTANMGAGGHNVPLLMDNKGIRKLTPRECFNLQGFPEDFKLPNISDSSLYKLVGNAVSVPVVKLIVDKLSQL
jgi:DNA (cytosine-5)-methyltransferase 1